MKKDGERRYLVMPVIERGDGYEIEGLGATIRVEDGEITLVGVPNISSIEKTLLSQKTDYKPEIGDTVIIQDEIGKGENSPKTKTNLHNHLAGILDPERLIILGIKHNVDYSLGLIVKYDIQLTREQKMILLRQVEGKIVLNEMQDIDKAFEELKGKIKNKTLNRELGKDAKVIMEGVTIPFRSLITTPENLAKVRDSLRLGENGQTVFSTLEDVYDARTPFTKGNGKGNYRDKPFNTRDKKELEEIAESLPTNYGEMLREVCNSEMEFSTNELQEDMMLWIAKGAKEIGVDYIETAQGVLTKGGAKTEDFIRVVNAIIPKIERVTGVKIRFLAAMRRNMNQVEQKSAVESMVESAEKCPYVVGCDFMGEELNETASFSTALVNIANYTKKNPNFVIRVHAGENSSFSRNISQVLDCIEAVYGDEEDTSYPPIRIGHGLYGPDETTEEGKLLLSRMKKMGVTVEFNLTSNVKLNNINDIKNSPLLTYLKYGIATVLGDDGGGIYGTDIREEQSVATSLLGLSESEIMKIIGSENQFKELDEKRESERANSEGTKVSYTYLSQEEFSGKIPHPERIPENIPESMEIINEQNPKAIQEIPQDKIPIIIAGGSFSTDGQAREASQGDIEILRNIIANADPSKHCFVIGNTFQGQERALIDLLESMNERFEVYVMSPEKVTPSQREMMETDLVTGIISVADERGAGIYKGFDDIIFSENREAIIYAFDGDAPIENLFTAGMKDGNLTINCSKGCKSLLEKVRGVGEGTRKKGAEVKAFSILASVNSYAKDKNVAIKQEEAKEFIDKFMSRLNDNEKSDDIKFVE